MLIPPEVIIKASKVLGDRMGILAMAKLENERLDASAVIVNPGGEILPSMLTASESNVIELLGQATVDVTYAIVDFAFPEEDENFSMFSYIDQDGFAICLLADPDDEDLQAELLEKMKE